MAELGRFLTPRGTSIREVMVRIGSAQGIALVVDEDRRLLGTVTDGDIRRAILAGTDLDRPVETLLEGRPPGYTEPLTAGVGTPDARLLQLMADSSLRHIPLVNGTGQVEDIAVLGDLIRDYESPITAVIMAGGYGTRLRPLTENVPKPMLPVGDKPLLEHTIEQLHGAGIRRLNITTHYKGHVIEEHFGDGSDFGVSIQYVDEERPLGTAGALGLMERSDEPVLVINGDIVTKVDLQAMVDFHRENRAAMTVAVRSHEFRVPYGLVETRGVEITAVAEKPVLRSFIIAGIYLLGPEVRSYIPAGEPCDMSDLIALLLADGRSVVSFPVHEYWMDIGRPEDYSRAQADANGEGGL